MQRGEMRFQTRAHLEIYRIRVRLLPRWRVPATCDQDFDQAATRLAHVVTVPPAAVVGTEGLRLGNTLQSKELAQQLKGVVLADTCERTFSRRQRLESWSQNVYSTSFAAYLTPAGSTYD